METTDLKTYRDACMCVLKEIPLAITRVKETIFYLESAISMIKEDLQMLENLEKSVTNPDSKV